MIKSNIRLLAIEKNIRFAKDIGIKANVSWDILNKLYENKNIGSIRMGNIFAIIEALNCNFGELIEISYPYVIEDELNICKNIKMIMAYREISTTDELIRRCGVSWSVINKISKHQIDSIELNSLLKISLALKCKIENLL